MTRKSQLQFIHRCTLLLESGITLRETLELVVSLESSKKNRDCFISLKDNVEKGYSFSRAIHLSIKGFNRSSLSHIRFGEISGNLPLSMRRAYNGLEKQGEMKKKIGATLIYPAFIATATIGMTIFLVMYIFPKIIPLFSSMNIELPFLTRAVKYIYESIVHFGLYSFVIFICTLLLAVFSYKKFTRIRLCTQRVILSLPSIGSLVRKFAIYNHFRSLGSLLESGESLPSALHQTAEESTLIPYSTAYMDCGEKVARGQRVSHSLKDHPRLFATTIPDMLSIGERTGTLSKMFLDISKMYEEEINEYIQHLSSFIEPLLMIIMGLVVGSIALSIILPVYEITNHLQH